VGPAGRLPMRSHLHDWRDRLRRDLHRCRCRRTLLGEETSKAKNRSLLAGSERLEPTEAFTRMLVVLLQIQYDPQKHCPASP
jgi:hypothetical protein